MGGDDHGRYAKRTNGELLRVHFRGVGLGC